MSSPLSLGDVTAIAAKASSLQAGLNTTAFALAQLQNAVNNQNASNAAAIAAVQSAVSGVYFPSLQLCTIETIASGSGSASPTEVTLASISGVTFPSTLQAVYLQVDMGVSVGSGGSFEVSPGGVSGTWFNVVSIPSMPTGSRGIVSGTFLLPCLSSFYYQSTGSMNTWTLRLIGYIG